MVGSCPLLPQVLLHPTLHLLIVQPLWQRRSRSRWALAPRLPLRLLLLLPLPSLLPLELLEAAGDRLCRVTVVIALLLLQGAHSVKRSAVKSVQHWT